MKSDLVLRIAQLSDIHIAHEGIASFDVDVKKNFCQLLDSIKKHPVDEIVVTGDISYRTGNEEVYEYVKDQLDKFGLPYYIISGNHDDTNMMTRVFFGEDKAVSEYYFSRENDDYLMLYLDTAECTMSDAQIEWLDKHVTGNTKQLIVFMHHPPDLMDVKYMDIVYPLENIETVMATLKKSRTKVNVFCGHYHVDKLCLNEINIRICPSGFFQLNQFSEDFKVDSLKVGWNYISVYKDRIFSSIRYID